MPMLWKSVVRRITSAALAALVLLPLALAGHRHDADAGDSAPKCAVCVAVRNTPAVRMTGVPQIAPPSETFAVFAHVSAAASPGDPPRPVGRAPPAGVALREG